MAQCTDGMCTSAVLSQLDDDPEDINISTDVGRYSSITLLSNGRGVVSYYDATSGDLKSEYCGEIACGRGSGGDVFDGRVWDQNGRDLGNGADVGQYTSITLGADGLGVLTYYDASNGDLKITGCSAIDYCGYTRSTLVVDSGGSGGDVGQYTSVTIGADGLPLISYYDVTNGNLKVAHCPNTFCVPFQRRR